MTNLIVIAKEPVPGRVKTRLSPHYSPAEAARLAEAALTDTLAVAAGLPVARRILVLDGRVGDWLPSGFEVLAQRGAGLDVLLANSFDDCCGPSLLIGMDTPQLSDELSPVLAQPWDCDAWFGPAADGGFWALGLARPDARLLRGVPMSR